MTTEQTSETLADSLRTVVHDAEDLMKATAGHGGEARTRLAAALESAKATCERLQDKTVAAAKATDRCIRAHPYESIGVAFGLGLLIGVLIRRR